MPKPPPIGDLITRVVPADRLLSEAEETVRSAAIASFLAEQQPTFTGK